MSDYVNNPTTGRMVKIGGKTHRSLINSGVLKNTRRDPRVLYTLDHGDDVHAIKQQLRETLGKHRNAHQTTGLSYKLQIELRQQSSSK